MKKIVSAAVAAGLLASAAFADVSFSYTNKNYFKSSVKVTEDTPAIATATATADPNKVTNSGSRQFGFYGSEQNVSLTLSNDIAGAHVAFDLKSTPLVEEIAKADNDQKTKVKVLNGAAFNNEMSLDDYYGWINFSKIHTTITAGAWGARWVDTCDDDAIIDDQDFALFNPGVINVADYRSDGWVPMYNVGFDSDNLTRKNLAMVAAFTMNVGPGTLLAKLGLVDVTGKAVCADTDGAYGFGGKGWHYGWDSDTPTYTAKGKELPNGETAGKNTWTGEEGDTTYIFYSGFVGEVAFRADNLFAVNLAVRSFEAHTASFGLFFSPLMIENLRATAGFTLGLNGSGFNKGTNTTWNQSAKNYDYIYKEEGTIGVEWAIDLRLRYQITDRLAFTTLNNFSSYLDRLMVDADPTETDMTKWTTNDFALWNQVNLTYDFADNLTAGFTIQHLDTDLDQQYTTVNHLYFVPSLQIQANDNLSFAVAARSHWQNIGSKETVKYDFTLPVSFTVKY